jgi:hypothetical protein
MATNVGEDRRLLGTEGFVVESPEGDVGHVEEVLLGEEREPRALVVRTEDGRHGLLTGQEVLVVDREYHWVVVSSEPALLELDEQGAANERAPSWTTTGDVFHASPRPPRTVRLPFHVPALRKKEGEPLLWQAIAVLLGSIAVIVALVVALAFLVARLVTGSPY